MRIEIVTRFDTSHTGNHSTTIEAKILTDTGIEICSGSDRDTWPDAKHARASTKRAVGAALDRMRHMLDNASDVAKRSGLL